MMTDNLDKASREKILGIRKKYNYESRMWIRFENYNVVEIDGRLSLSDLRMLVEIMEAIQ